MTDHSSNTRRSWFHEPWMWLVVALPAATVIAGFTTLFLAARGSDELVRDDFRKDGLAIYADPARDAAAVAAGASARLQIDPAAAVVRLDVNLERGELPREMLLVLSHSTRAEFDRMARLAGRDGHYQAALAGLPAGRWYVEVTPPDRAWRLRGSFEEASPVVDLEAAGTP